MIEFKPNAGNGEDVLKDGQIILHIDRDGRVHSSILAQGFWDLHPDELATVQERALKMHNVLRSDPSRSGIVGAYVEFIREVPHQAALPGERGIVLYAGSESFQVVTTWHPGHYQTVWVHKSEENVVWKVLHPGYVGNGFPVFHDGKHYRDYSHWREHFNLYGRPYTPEELEVLNGKAGSSPLPPDTSTLH